MKTPRELPYYHYQSAASPEEAAEWLGYMYHIKFQRKAHSYSGAWFGFGNMTVSFRLPGGLILTRVIGNNWTALD